MKSSKPPPESTKLARQPNSATETSAAPKDIALIHGVTADGGLRIIRQRDGHLEAGAVHPIREGAPIHGELVTLKPRSECPVLCDVEVHYAPAQTAARGLAGRAGSTSDAAPPRKGPAQVATDTYRDNWDSIWSQKKKPAALN